MTEQGIERNEVRELELPVLAPLVPFVFQGFENLEKLKLTSTAPFLLNADILRNLPRLQELDLEDSLPIFHTFEFWIQRGEADSQASPLDPENQAYRVELTTLQPDQAESLKQQMAEVLHAGWPALTVEEILTMDFRDIFSRLVAFRQEFVYPFQENPQLKTIRLPRILQSLPAEALRNASALEEVIFDAPLLEVAPYALAGCKALKTVDLSQTNLKVIGRGAFQDCSALTEIRFPDSLETLGEEAFLNCAQLELPHLPSSLMQLGEGAFAGCVRFTAVDLSAFSLKEVPGRCFAGCSNLKEIVLPASVTSVGERAFDGTALKTLDLSPYVSLVTLGVEAFSCPNLEHIILPEALQSLEGSFSECSNLRTVDFSRCSQLMSIHNAFSGCANLAKIDLSNCTALEVIERFAFDGCKHIEKVTLPTSLRKIDEGAFRDCLRLTKINLEACENLTAIGEKAFWGNQWLDSVKLPASLESLGTSAFAACSGIEVVDLSQCSRLHTIETAAFFGMRRLGRVLFPQRAKLTIGPRAFKGNSRLSEVTFPKGVVQIGKDAFADCMNLSKIVWQEERCPDVAEGAFAGGPANQKEVTLVR